jgi:hypothetical protein
MQELIDRIFADARETMPLPYQPLVFSDAIAALDHLSVQDRIDDSDLSLEDRDLVGGGSCQARAGGVLGSPVVCGPVGFVEPFGEAAVGGLGVHADDMRPPDHDHGSVGVVRAAVVAKGRPPN